MGIVTQVPIMLSGKTILVDCMVIEDPLEFNMLLGCDYIYHMKVVVSTLFHVMYFPHDKSIVTINQLPFVDPPPHPTIEQVYTLLITNVLVDSALPRVNYVASYTSCPIANEKKPLDSCLPSWDLVPTID